MDSRIMFLLITVLINLFVPFNSKSSSEHLLESGMQTTKADADIHGMGTRIIDKAVKKMGGFVKRIDEGERFKVRVMIPVQE